MDSGLRRNDEIETGCHAFVLAYAERQRGCARLTLAVFPGNARARALYGRRGFGVDLLRMAKPLD
jgi:RimJ/RimL family protein N-acetyltransferase